MRGSANGRSSVARGSCGKIVEIALGVEATKQKRRVLFTRAADLVRQFETNRGIAAFRSESLLYRLSLSRDDYLREAQRKEQPQDQEAP